MRREESETFISRSKLVILYVGFYLALLGVAARAYVFYFVQDMPPVQQREADAYGWPVMALIALFAALAVARHWRRTGLQRHTGIYLAVQSTIIVWLLYLPPFLDMYAILFFHLSLQAMLTLSRREGFTWIAFFGVLTTAGMILGQGLAGGLAMSLVYAGGYYFFGSFAAATAEAELSRRESQALLHDLREREESLRQSEERYRRLVEECPDAILVLSEEGRIVDGNTRSCELLRAEREELVGSMLADYHPQYDEEHWEQVLNLLARPEDAPSVRLEEAALMRKNGEKVEVEAQLGVIRLQGVPHLLAIVRDVSERQRAQEALLSQTRDLALLEERNRMAREIHDTLAQGFTGIVVQLEAAEQAMTRPEEDVERHLAMAKAQARDSLQEARRSIWDLVPRALEARALEAALREEVARFNAGGRERAKLRLIGSAGDLAPDIQTAVLRVCQESLTNVQRHAGATEVDLELNCGLDAIELCVSDNGVGFEATDAAEVGGFGLRGMSARAQALGGTLSIDSAQGQGTRVRLRLPIVVSSHGLEPLTT
jgi:PAS domain S-box-containing protein